MAQSILNQWISVEVQNIYANHIFEFGDTGRALYRSDSIPNTLDWLMMVIEIDRDIRSFSEDVDLILPDDQKDIIAQNIIKLVGIAASPQTAAVIALAKVYYSPQASAGGRTFHIFDKT